MENIESKKLTVTTATVQIKILQINNRKFTKSTFNQIPVESPISNIDQKIKGDFIGRINDNGKWFLLWVKNNELRICRIIKNNEGWCLTWVKDMKIKKHLLGNIHLEHFYIAT